MIREHERISVSLRSDGCQSSPRNRTIYLEHVQAIVTLSSSKRGELEVYKVLLNLLTIYYNKTMSQAMILDEPVSLLVQLLQGEPRDYEPGPSSET